MEMRLRLASFARIVHQGDVRQPIAATSVAVIKVRPVCLLVPFHAISVLIAGSESDSQVLAGGEVHPDLGAAANREGFDIARVEVFVGRLVKDIEAQSNRWADPHAGAVVLKNSEPEGIIQGETIIIIIESPSNLFLSVDVTRVKSIIEQPRALRVGRVCHADADPVAVETRFKIAFN